MLKIKRKKRRKDKFEKDEGRRINVDKKMAKD